MLLEAWRDFEREDGDEKSQAEVQLFFMDWSSHLCKPLKKILQWRVSLIEIYWCCHIYVFISFSLQVLQLLPRRVKKRRKVQGEDGSDQGWEEYFDYIFPEDEAAKPNLKLLAMAKMWKKNKEVSGGDAEEEEEEQQEETETDVETESRRIDVMADKEGEEEEEEEENPDADDPTIANESSSSSESEDEEEEDSSKKAKRQKRSK